MSRGSPRCLLFFGHLSKFTVTVTVTVASISFFSSMWQWFLVGVLKLAWAWARQRELELLPCFSALHHIWFTSALLYNQIIVKKPNKATHKRNLYRNLGREDKPTRSRNRNRNRRLKLASGSPWKLSWPCSSSRGQWWQLGEQVSVWSVEIHSCM